MNVNDGGVEDQLLVHSKGDERPHVFKWESGKSGKGEGEVEGEGEARRGGGREGRRGGGEEGRGEEGSKERCHGEAQFFHQGYKNGDLPCMREREGEGDKRVEVTYC